MPTVPLSLSRRSRSSCCCWCCARSIITAALGLKTPKFTWRVVPATGGKLLSAASRSLCESGSGRDAAAEVEAEAEEGEVREDDGRPPHITLLVLPGGRGIEEDAAKRAPEAEEESAPRSAAEGGGTLPIGVLLSELGAVCAAP